MVRRSGGYLRVLQVSGQRSVGSTHVLLLLSDLLQLLLQILFLHLIIQTDDSRVDQENQFTLLLTRRRSSHRQLLHVFPELRLLRLLLLDEEVEGGDLLLQSAGLLHELCFRLRQV